MSAYMVTHAMGIAALEPEISSMTAINTKTRVCRSLWCAALLLAMLATACSNRIQVFADVDPDYDLWTYRTYTWGPRGDLENNPNPRLYNAANDQCIKNAVAQELAPRGYRYTDSAPDLVLHYHIILEDKTAVIPDPYGYTYGPYWQRTHTDLYLYKEGTLVVDLMDARTSNLVWRGWAVSVLDKHYSAAEVEKLIQTVVAGIFRKFPAKTTHYSAPSGPGQTAGGRNIVQITPK